MRIGQYNVLAQSSAIVKYFPYARKFLPAGFIHGFVDSGNIRNWDASPFSRGREISEDFISAETFLDPVIRLQMVMSEIATIKADIVCLCEVDEPDRFSKFFRTRGYCWKYQRRPNGRKDGCMILWRSEIFEIVEGSMRVRNFQATDRIALCVTLRNKKDGNMFNIISTHLYWDRDSPLHKSDTDELISFIKEIRAINSTVHFTALCGDFNAVRGSETYRRISELLVEACEAGNLTPPEFTSLVPDLAERNGDQWFVKKGRKEEIDFIFMQGNFKITNHSASHNGPLRTGRKVLTVKDGKPVYIKEQDEFGIPNDFHGSDHLPVFADFEIVKD